jgi:hypothetical protein
MGTGLIREHGDNRFDKSGETVVIMAEKAPTPARKAQGVWRPLVGAKGEKGEKSVETSDRAALTNRSRRNYRLF